jgi:isopentenyl phosphate kinase
VKDVVLLKLGGSIITRKDLSDPQINEPNLRRIGREIAESYKNESFNLVIVHGAGSYGHPIVKRTGIHDGIGRQDQVLSFAQTQLLQNKLNYQVCQILQEFELPAIPVQPSASAIMDAKRLVSLHSELIKSLLSITMIPVLFGVPAFDMTQKCSILSGDQIIVYLAKQLNPRVIVLASNVDGILGKDQQLIERITPANYPEVKTFFYEASYDDVTGSMAGKIAELTTLEGVKSYIINGNTPGLIENVLKGKEVRGTSIEF